MNTCIELVEDAHRRLQTGKGFQPLRTGIFPEGSKGLLATMPAYLSNPEIYGMKAVSVFHDNHNLGLESHQGAIILIDPQTGVLMAVVDGAEITAMRTAAASAVATRYLSREDSTSLSLIGSGVQAHSHLAAISQVRELDEVIVWSRANGNAKRFMQDYADQYKIRAVRDIEGALQSDIICTLTASATPLFDLNMVEKGSHINAVGASSSTTRELESGFVQGATWFTDVYESVANESGALVIPLKEGLIKKLPTVTELGALITGEHSGRTYNDEITVYKSLGVGIQDIVTAQHVLEEAQKQNMGVMVDF